MPIGYLKRILYKIIQQFSALYHYKETNILLDVNRIQNTKLMTINT